MIKSISYNEQEILRDIIQIHCNGKDIELDPTYSRGNFYKDGVKEPIYKFDIYPQKEGVVQANVEHLPLPDNCIEVAIFDPPFLATKGDSLKIKDKRNRMVKRFGVYPTEKELFQFYTNSLLEFYRIMKDKGTVIWKTQDKVSGGKQYWSHLFIMQQAEKLGFYCKDLFILMSKHRMVPKWQKNQQHARKFHCYYIVLQKINKKVSYL